MPQNGFNVRKPEARLKSAAPAMKRETEDLMSECVELNFRIQTGTGALIRSRWTYCQWRMCLG